MITAHIYTECHTRNILDLLAAATGGIITFGDDAGRYTCRRSTHPGIVFPASVRGTTCNALRPMCFLWFLCRRDIKNIFFNL